MRQLTKTRVQGGQRNALLLVSQQICPSSKLRNARDGIHPADRAVRELLSGKWDR